MFKNFTNHKPIEKVVITSLSSLADADKEYIFSIFGMIPPYSFVIYGGTEKDNILLLGYYVLDRLSITNSPFFSALCENTKNVNGVNLTPEFYRRPSIHISSWVFDEAIRNERALNTIFRSMTQYCDTNADMTFLWTDTDTAELLYYPLEKSDGENDNRNTVTYFWMKFMKL